MLGIRGRTSSTRLGFFMLSALFLSLFLISPAYATDYYWIGGSGDWSDPNNWNPTGPPQGWTSSAYLTQSDAVNRTVNLSSSILYPPGRLYIDGTGTGTMTLSIAGGAIGTRSEIGINGTGMVNQTGGALGGQGGQGPSS